MTTSADPSVPATDQHTLWQETVLRAVILKLTALDGGELNSTVGELGLGAFYAAIDAADPSLATQIHDAQNRKAFSLSPLYGITPGRGGRITIRTGDEARLRLGLLDDRLFAAFIRQLLAQRLPAIRLGAVRFAVTEVLGAPESDPWAGYTTMGDLARLGYPPDRWTLEFASPTAIRWGKADDGTRRAELFPLPRMAVAGLRSRWDALTGDTWGRDFEEWVERNVIVSRVERWRTQPFPYRRQTYLGGLGSLEYRLLDARDQAAAAHLHRLLHLAFYTGIGYKTTHGLGQVRLRFGME
ncbi:MAG: CRISPR-associated endoribonuclease Cas6 [Caldilineaceae bacterium]|nr:CRISPR-associated endoribonuclease Cas6 [Caldilineaceae bacterium]